RALRGAAHGPGVRFRPAAARVQAGPARGHVDDGEAGRLRRPGEHHPSGPGQFRGVPADRPQVVHLGADGRPVHGARAGARRAGLTMAAHHAAHRMAFGRELAGQPLMAAVLADLAIESEATTLAAFRLAGATDRAVRGDAQEGAFRRLALAATKYWVCKRAPAHAAEALECLGGNGYVEESGMPRLYREAPLASIWEGSGNVAALDALRALTRQPGSAEAFFAELDF